MDLIELTFNKYAQDCIGKNLTLESSIVHILNLNPMLKQDVIFTTLFPIIFNIEKCKYNINV
jgi:hypothetical protein